MQVVEPIYGFADAYGDINIFKRAQEEPREREEEAKAYLSGWCGILEEKGISAGIYTTFGPIVYEILNMADREKVDMIAMSSHGRTESSSCILWKCGREDSTPNRFTATDYSRRKRPVMRITDLTERMKHMSMTAPTGIDIVDENPVRIAHFIDHTLLKPDATPQQLRQLCQEALEYTFASVCINPIYVSLAESLLTNSSVKVCTVIGFPLGATTTEVKIFETEQALAQGAREIDMVINIGALKAGDDEAVKQDIAGVVQMAHQNVVLQSPMEHEILCKVIIETTLLTNEEKRRVCHLAMAVGADFVKTSTGFSRAGATVEDVALMRDTVGPTVGVKASGRIRTLTDVKRMLAAGANRIGTSSSVNIMQEVERLMIS